MKLRKFALKSLKAEVAGKASLVSLKKNWNPKIKPYLNKVSKSFCFFDLNLSFLLMKEAFNLVSVLCEKKRLPIFQYCSISWSWLDWISHPRVLDWIPLFFFLDFMEVKEEEKKKKPLIFSIGKKDSKRENIGVLSEVSGEDSIGLVDYPILGNSRSYGGTIFFYSLVVSLMLESVVADKKSKKTKLVVSSKKWKH